MTTLLPFVIMIYCVANNITYGGYLRRAIQFDNTDAPSNMTGDQILGKSFLNCAVICHQTATCATLFVKKIPPMYLCKFINYTLLDLKDCINYSDGFKVYERGGTFSFIEPSMQITTVPDASMITTQAYYDTTLATYTTVEVMTQPDTTDDLKTTSSSQALTATSQTTVDVAEGEEDVSSENDTDEQGSGS